MSSPKFKPGDKVLLVPINPKRQDWYGIETTVIRLAGFFNFKYAGWQFSYILECGGIENDGWAESALQKIPPKQQTTTWESCVWRPEGVTS